MYMYGLVCLTKFQKSAIFLLKQEKFIIFIQSKIYAEIYNKNI